MGFALSVQIAALSWILNTQFGFDEHEGVMDELLSSLSEYDGLIFGTLRPYELKAYLGLIGGFQGLKVLVPQGLLRDFEGEAVVEREISDSEVEDVFSVFDYCVLSDEDVANPLSKYRRWVELSGAKIVMTQGPKGAIVINPRSFDFSVPTVGVDNIVDSTGSGEIFVAAFVHSLLGGATESDAIAFAHKVCGFSLLYTPEELSLLNYS